MTVPVYVVIQSGEWRDDGPVPAVTQSGGRTVPAVTQSGGMMGASRNEEG